MASRILQFNWVYKKMSKTLTVVTLVSWLLVTYLISISSSNAVAANISFVPGDSFFHFYATKENIEAGERDSVSYRYGPPETDGAGDFDGHVGFAMLKVRGDSRLLRKGMSVAYQEYRKLDFLTLTIVPRDGHADMQVEANPMHAFVYNADLDVTDFNIGLKFNEKWWSVPGGREIGAKDLVDSNWNRKYRSFITEKSFYLNDWRFAEEVPGLRAVVPDNIVWWDATEEIADPPITVNANDIRIVMTGYGQLDKLIQRKEDSYFIVIDALGCVDFYSYEGGKRVHRKLLSVNSK